MNTKNWLTPGPLRALFFTLLLSSRIALAGDPAATGAGETRDSKTLQAARNAAVAARGLKSYYPPNFDLSGLPHYDPKEKLAGTMRIWGMNYLNDGQLKKFWDQGFHKYHPDVKIEWYLPTAVTATPGLVTGTADLGANTNMWQWEAEEFEQVLGYQPTDVPMCVNSYNVAGWGAIDAAFVHKSNPLKQITVEQLDRIFGSERTGGWVGTIWHPEFARGPEQNIRTWGQLGLTGEWADKPIHIYAINLRYHTMADLSNWIMHGSDKWNEDARMYSNVVRGDGKIVASFDLLIEALSKDPYGIAITGIQTLTPAVKALALSQDGGPYVTPTLQTTQNLTYPFSMTYHWTVNRKPGEALNPLVKEFLTYALSQEGQEDVMRDGKFLPLPAEISKKAIAQLDDTTVKPATAILGRTREKETTPPYTNRWDLSDLPAYAPKEKVTGVIRLWGMPQLAEGNLADYWAAGFKKYHPDAKIEYHLKSSLSGTSAIITGAGDLGASPRLRFSKLLGFQRLFLDHDPVEIPMFTGSYNIPGFADAQAVFVGKGNPLTHVSLKQLDGIAGTRRDGGWVGTTWHTEYPSGRGPEENIRTWGQLGLTGEWADKPIHVYSYQQRQGTAIFLSDAFMHGGDKMTDNTKVYADIVGPDGKRVRASTQLMADLSKDPYGLGFSGIEFATPETKAVAVSANENGEGVPLTIETVRDRSYPLARETYWYLNRNPGEAVDPKVREFLTYVMSREGQEEVMRDGKFLPLRGVGINEQLKKIN